MSTYEFIFMFLLFGTVCSNIDNKLYYYETLSSLGEVQRVKRSIDGITRHTDRDINFNAFGKAFKLLLENNADILSSDFKAMVVRKDGSSARINVNKNEFYRGHLADDKDSLVDAHIEDGIWTANIYTKQDSYHIEPSWRHLPKSNHYSHIVYRGSDIKHISTPGQPDLKPQKLHDGIKVDVDPKDIIFDERKHGRAGDWFHPSNRTKRQSWISQANSCQLYVAADHLFHNGIGGGVPHVTLNYIINTFHAVNNIYRKTIWEENTDISNVGFQLREMKIHEKSTPVKAGELHYNMHQSSQWDTRELLEVFSRQNYHDNFCLAHLFTYQKFKGGVLGLAYIASPRQRTVGGICSPSYTKDHRKLTLNSGWSSSMNTNGDRLLTQEANLVTAHELGHNWGSEHDAETDECAPSSVTGDGKFIMYPYAVKGYEVNNRIFSPCSLRYVADVLKAKAYNCFTAQVVSAPYCGNGIVDTAEECDGGKTGKEGSDPCCSADCKLIGISKCSRMNHECCKNCQMAPKDFVCREAYVGGCDKTAKCTGSSFGCPTSDPESNTTKCLEGGICNDGECISFCKRKNAESCRCENNVNDACYRCCRGQDGQCRKLDSSERLPEGRACYLGFCSTNGICEKSEQDMIQRLFSFIENITPNAFVEFMRRNIVGTVMVFSMVIWIPASWTYSCIDKKRDEKERMLSDWRSNKSINFMQKQDYATLRISTKNRLPRHNNAHSRVPRHAVSVRQPEMIVQQPKPRFQRDEHPAPRYQQDDPASRHEELRNSSPRYQEDQHRHPAPRYQEDQHPALRYQDDQHPAPRYQEDQHQHPVPRYQEDQHRHPAPRYQEDQHQHPAPRYQEDQHQHPAPRYQEHQHPTRNHEARPQISETTL